MVKGFGRKSEAVAETAQVPQIKDNVYLGFAFGHMWRSTLAFLVAYLVVYFVIAILFYAIYGADRSEFANILAGVMLFVVMLFIVFWIWGKIFQQFILREKVVKGYELALQADSHAPDLSKEWAVWSVAFAHAWPVVIIQFAANQILILCAEVIVPKYGHMNLFSLLSLLIGIYVSAWRLRMLIGRNFGGYRLVLRLARKD